MAELDFRKAIIPDEIDALCEFDSRSFADHPADIFSKDDWKKYESYWMIVDGKKAGCAAFDETNRDELWVASTAILPEYRRQGLGRRFKRWQIDYAKSHGFARLGTVMRPSNTAINELNKEFGFKLRKMRPKLYSDPPEDGIEMELLLPDPVCPECGKPLRTRRSKQCRFCGADWH